ncbi:hypothetical protein EST38_g12587 [Candolleomyces aberdarensis]|uniref:Uncharacterized protein n=1 Tax=Candolleomyces aberdarensis TaxID=2316362 RepID=A0A4Q2D212_9AGAR|nr:hypothetical protein EST38_g12587 [Candolleomyces aberdarensis]
MLQPSTMDSFVPCIIRTTNSDATFAIDNPDEFGLELQLPVASLFCVHVSQFDSAQDEQVPTNEEVDMSRTRQAFCVIA